MDKIRILIADDESRMRKLVNDFLSKEGYEVIEASDGNEALDRFYEDKELSDVAISGEHCSPLFRLQTGRPGTSGAKQAFNMEFDAVALCLRADVQTALRSINNECNPVCISLFSHLIYLLYGIIL